MKPETHPISRRTLLAGGFSVLASAAAGYGQEGGGDRLRTSALHYASLLDTAEQIRRRKLSPVELTKAQIRPSMDAESKSA